MMVALKHTKLHILSYIFLYTFHMPLHQCAFVCGRLSVQTINPLTKILQTINKEAFYLSRPHRMALNSIHILDHLN